MDTEYGKLGNDWTGISQRALIPTNGMCDGRSKSGDILDLDLVVKQVFFFLPSLWVRFYVPYSD
jgi:hypothetical protein